MRTINHPQHQHQPQQVAGVGEFIIVQTPQGPQWAPAPQQGVGQTPGGTAWGVTPSNITGSAAPMSPLTTLLIVGGVAAAGIWAYRKYLSPSASLAKEAEDNPDLYVRHQRLRRSRARVMGEVKRMLQEVEAAEGDMANESAEEDVAGELEAMED